jgi:hypothetical protein
MGRPNDIDTLYTTEYWMPLAFSISKSLSWSQPVGSEASRVWNFRWGPKAKSTQSHHFIKWLSSAVIPRGILVRMNACLLAGPTDGFIPAANCARCRSSNAGCLHSSSKLRQGLLWYPARSNRLWIHLRPPHYDSGIFPLTLL